MRPTILLCALFLLAPTLAFADPPQDRAPAIPDAKIDEAKALLEGAKIGTRYIGATDAVLAIWRIGSDEPVKKLSVRNGTSQDPAFTVGVARGGGLGTVYEVTDPSGYETIAFRMNVHDDTKRPWFKGVTTVTVTDTMITDDRVAAGIRHLRDMTAAARERFRERKVLSIVAGHQRETVAADVPDLALLALPIVERVAPEIAAGVDPTLAIRRALTGFAVNGEDAYDYAKSPVGARGAYQFMPGTYRVMHQTYVRAHLDWNFLRGTRDHANAATAEACLADFILSKLGRRQLRKLFTAGDEEVGAAIAAAYNGGDKPLLCALEYHPASWDQYHGRHRGLCRATTVYVATFRTVYRYLQQHQ